MLAVIATIESCTTHHNHALNQPATKIQKIKGVQDQGRKVAMIGDGDGINDAPALTQADIGIAMRSGTDVAIQASDITLVSGDLIGVLTAIRLSKSTMKNIKQNLFWAFAYNTTSQRLVPVYFIHCTVYYWIP